MNRLGRINVVVRGRGGSGHRPPPPSFRVPPYVVVPTLVVTGTIGYAYVQCRNDAPLTGRRRIIATSPDFERSLGDGTYRQFLHKYRSRILPVDHPASVTVRRVGGRIADSAKRFSDVYLPPAPSSSSSSSSSSPPYIREADRPYTYTIVRTDEANAFVLPGNHVFVLTGLFKYVRDEDELAAVLGHEVAHCLARHAGERMSSGMLWDIVARLSLLVDPSGGLYLLLIGPASTLFHTLPNSREAEMEADQIGLHLAADACYDPRAAKRVFLAMKHDASSKNDKTPPEFLSTHPSYDTRLVKFDDWMPAALSIYNAKDDGDGGTKCRRVREEMSRARKRAADEMLARNMGRTTNVGGVTRRIASSPSSSSSSSSSSVFREILKEEEEEMFGGDEGRGGEGGDGSFGGGEESAW